MENLQRERRLLERLAKKNMDGTLGKKDETDDVLGDDMSVRIGDEVNNYYGVEPNQEAQSSRPLQISAGKANAETVKKTLSPLVKTGLVAAATALGGAGVGAATTLLLSKSDKPDKPVVQAPLEDTNTQYELRIH